VAVFLVFFLIIHIAMVRLTGLLEIAILQQVAERPHPQQIIVALLMLLRLAFAGKEGVCAILTSLKIGYAAIPSGSQPWCPLLVTPTRAAVRVCSSRQSEQGKERLL